MKTVTIGREPGSAIQLHHDMTSRRHALLRLHKNGKIELVDFSSNGTFVNGMRVPPQKPYPVKRSDVVLFAKEEKLDWKSVPNPQKTILFSIILAVAALALIVGLVFTVKSCTEGGVTEAAYEGGGGTTTSPEKVNADEGGTSLSPGDRYKGLKSVEQPKKKSRDTADKAKAAEPKHGESAPAETKKSEDQEALDNMQHM